jgi:hypothetical protein
MSRPDFLILLEKKKIDLNKLFKIMCILVYTNTHDVKF